LKLGLPLIYESTLFSRYWIPCCRQRRYRLLRWELKNFRVSQGDFLRLNAQELRKKRLLSLNHLRPGSGKFSICPRCIRARAQLRIGLRPNRLSQSNPNIIHRRKLILLKTKPTDRTQKADETPSLEIFSGFIKLHVLHHASEQPVYGLWLIEELAEHGYRVSPGTLYPLLHSLEESEMLRSHNEVSSGKVRRYYTITPTGRRQLKRAKLQLIELLGEILTKEEAEQLINVHS